MTYTEKLKGDECDWCNKWRSLESESNNHTYHTFVSVVLFSIQIIGVSIQIFKSYLEAKCSFIFPSWIIWRHYGVFKFHLKKYLASFEYNLSYWEELTRNLTVSMVDASHDLGLTPGTIGIWKLQQERMFIKRVFKWFLEIYFWLVTRVSPPTVAFQTARAEHHTSQRIYEYTGLWLVSCQTRRPLIGQ